MDSVKMRAGHKPWWMQFYIQTGVSQQFDDWHPDVFKNFDPDTWVEMIASTGADSCHIQAKCHSGNAYYVSELDHLHLGFHGRDAFGELLDSLHKRGVKVFANQSILYDTLLYKQHPDWRLIDAEGRDSKQLAWRGKRPGVCCFNSPYRELARAQLEAFARKYRPDVMLMDMMFAWLPVCYCRYCTAQYMADSGLPLPGKDDRSSLAFRSYLRWRDERLYQFTKLMIDTFKAIHPDVPMLFNSPRPHLSGPMSTLKMAGLADFVGGDPVQDDPSPASIGYSASTWMNMKPDRTALMTFGRFHASEAQHTGMRSLDEMTISCLVSAIYNNAIQLFDNCNVDGTLYPSAFAAFKEVFSRVHVVEPYLGGEKIRCAGVYLSEDTNHFLYECCSRHEVDTYVSGLKHTFKAFHDLHIPVDVITKLNLADLASYKLVCLEDALCLMAEEVRALQDYVANGGNLIATRFASLADQDGQLLPNFALADVFGVDYLGMTENAETYMRIDPGLCRAAGAATDQEVKYDVQSLVRARPGTDVRGRLVLPYTNRANDGERWIGCWASPPGLATDFPTVVRNHYGRGVCWYVSGRLNALDHQHSVVEPRALIAALGRDLLGTAIPVQVQAPPWVTVTAYRQEENKRLVVHLVNAPNELPLVAQRSLPVQVTLHPGERAIAVRMVPDGEPIRYRQAGTLLRFRIPELVMYQGTVVELG